VICSQNQINKMRRI